MGARAEVVICGAGPTGLGAAWRLEEYRLAGHDCPRWRLLESHDRPGGMAASEAVDGFVWDLGGHVLFPHYRYFDDLLDELVDDWNYVTPVRGAWMWGRFIPYPVQRNLRHFPSDVLAAAIAGLREPPASTAPRNFGEFLMAQFGSGLHRDFFEPLNLKMWATHPDDMAMEWADQRSGSATANVPRVDLAQVLADIDAGRDAPGWNADTTIRYPANGGTGRIWSELLARLPSEQVGFGREVAAVHTRDRTLELSDGERVHYDSLVSSMPLDRLLRTITDQPELARLADRLRPAATESVGFGLAGDPPPQLSDICSLYIPDLEIVFWRVTVLSNYSAGNTPPNGRHWSLLCEVNTGADRPRPTADVVERARDGLIELGFIDPDQVVAVWHRSLTHGYPVPHLGRDADLAEIQRVLESFDIYSRGRFGGWRYEASNQDHAFMQGLELIDRLVAGTPETTYPTPTSANSRLGATDRQRIAPV